MAAHNLWPHLSSSMLLKTGGSAPVVVTTEKRAVIVVFENILVENILFFQGAINM